MKFEDYVIDMNGTKRWYNEVGKLHREGGLPPIEYKNGTKYWIDENQFCVRWDEWIDCYEIQKYRI